MPKYKLAIFDSDGTLADTLHWFRAAYDQLAPRYGIPPLSDGDDELLRTLTPRKLLAHLKIPLWRLPPLIAGMRRHMNEHIREFSLFDGIADSLQHLAANGVTIGIVSSNSRENVEAILGPENAALIRHWDCGASMFGKPAKLRSVVRASGFAARDAIYVGDELRDAEAAHKAGLAYGAVAWGCHPLEALRAQGAAEYFKEPREIGDKLAVSARPCE
jgi:phosphoglycolate phosphatase